MATATQGATYLSIAGNIQDILILIEPEAVNLDFNIEDLGPQIEKMNEPGEVSTPICNQLWTTAKSVRDLENRISELQINISSLNDEELATPLRAKAALIFGSLQQVDQKLLSLFEHGFSTLLTKIDEKIKKMVKELTLFRTCPTEENLEKTYQEYLSTQH